jgi:hypothetical protein
MMPPNTRDSIVPVPPDTVLSQEQSAALMSDFTFRGRVKVCCVKYADSIVIASVAVSTHTAAVKWAFRCFQVPDTVAGEVQPGAVMDGKVQSEGSAVTDQDLQSAVEATVGKTIS